MKIQTSLYFHLAFNYKQMSGNHNAMPYRATPAICHKLPLLSLSTFVPIGPFVYNRNTCA